MTSCPACAAPIALDQRYCLACGHAARSALDGVRRALAPPAAAPASASTESPWGPFGGLLATGLGVGILAGALISPPEPSRAAPQIALAAVPAPAPPPAATPGPPLAPPEPPPVPRPASPPAPAPVPMAPAPEPAPPARPEPRPKPRPAPAPEPLRLPAVGHVWLVALADQRFDDLYGPDSPARFLNDTLVGQGTLLTGYEALADGTLANGIALLSGRRSTPQIDSECPVYEEGACLFGPDVATLPTQLEANALTWRAYVAGQGAPGDPLLSCRRPAPGGPDPTAASDAPPDGYVTRRNPFVYFHAIVDQPTCPERTVGLEQLDADLAAPEPPAFSWVAPGLCEAGVPAACPPDGRPAGTAAVDAYLADLVPRIQATPSYQEDGLIVIVADRSARPATEDDPQARRTGALLLSPLVHRGRTVPARVDHLTLLRTFEDLFGLPYLGAAASREPLAQDVFPGASGGDDAVATTR